MAIAARWIRLETDGAPALRAACAGFALAQSAGSAPAVLWSRAGEDGLAFALVAPLKFAPGRLQRWRSWALSPLIAAFRQAGLRAYLEGDGVCLSGRRIAGSEVSAVGGCAVVAASFALPDARFMDRLRERIESQHGWQFDHSWPTEQEKEVMLERANAH